MPPDVGGYQRQFQLLLPGLATRFGRMCWIGAVRDALDIGGAQLEDVRTVRIPAHRLPRRARGLADLVVVAAALASLFVDRVRRQPPGALLLLSPTMVGGSWLVSVAGVLGWRTSARFPSGGDQVHPRGRAVGRSTNTANLVPSPGQSKEQDQFPVTVLLNAVRPRLRSEPTVGGAEAGTFLFLGRLVRDKRPELTLRSWAEIAGELPGWKLVFAGGGGEQRDSVEEAMRRFMTTFDVPRCELFGFVSEPEMLLQQADVLLFPSLREGLPNVVLEAMASGVPVLADSGLATGWFGRSVPLLDWDGRESTFSSAMWRAAREPHHRARVATEGLSYVASRHDPVRIAEDLGRCLASADARGMLRAD